MAPLAEYAAHLPSARRGADRRRGARGRHLRRARQRPDRSGRRRRERVSCRSTPAGKALGVGGRVRRRTGVGDRVSRPARAAVRVFDRAAAGDGRCARCEPDDRRATNRSAAQRLRAHAALPARAAARRRDRRAGGRVADRSGHRRRQRARASRWPAHCRREGSTCARFVRRPCRRARRGSRLGQRRAVRRAMLDRFVRSLAVRAQGGRQSCSAASS